jgi:hypothetical protein
MRSTILGLPAVGPLAELMISMAKAASLGIRASNHDGHTKIVNHTLNNLA